MVYKIQSTWQENVNCILLFSSYVMRPVVNVNSIAKLKIPQRFVNYSLLSICAIDIRL